ncbi:MAG: dynamin family protein, partial [Deltaproteobacteria bacterium]|nr:dynamin family protein [Deltaproteobacteria bacterium]
MSRLVEALTRFFGRVEILARGADAERREAQAALEAGRFLEAREHARALLARVPSSPIGLALWADAAGAVWLDEEAATAFSQLAQQVPWRHDVWLRLGLAGGRTGWPQARLALERAAAATEDRAVARRALQELCDVDLRAGEPARARRWVERLAAASEAGDPEVELRRGECLLAEGEVQAARLACADLELTGRADGRDRLLLARLGGGAGGRKDENLARRIDLALGAFVLGAPGAAELLAQLVAAAADPALVERARRVLGAGGCLEQPEWVAAFALREGRPERAREALLRGFQPGEGQRAAALLSLVVEGRDLEALATVGERDPAALTDTMHALLAAERLHEQGKDGPALERLDALTGTELGDWAAELARRWVGGWVPEGPGDAARWDRVLEELGRGARRLGRLDRLPAIEALIVEQERPLRVAVVGEFNAGKSTLINAWLAADVAPTGVTPTTACLHWVAWAPDAFTRVVARGQPDRIVAHADLKAALREIAEQGGAAERVYIYAPIERLRRMDLLDTPGLNAPEAAHAEQARAGIEEAHVAIWLLDATQALKETERQAIQAAARAGVPVQLVVNKSDRLAAGETERVLAHVEAELRGAGLRSHRPVLALSSRLALRARLGQVPETALVESGWQPFEEMLEAHVINRCDELKERALRRKAAAVAADLGAAAARRAGDCREQLADERTRTERIRAYAATIESQRRDVASELEAELGPARELLLTDAQPVAELASAQQRDDAEVRSYLVARTVERFAPVVCRALAARAQRGGPGEAAPGTLPELEVPVRAAIGGAAAATASGSVLEGTALRAALEVALGGCAQALRAAADVPVQAPPFEALRVRLAALERALGAGAAVAGGRPPELAPAFGGRMGSC